MAKSRMRRILIFSGIVVVLWLSGISAVDIPAAETLNGFSVTITANPDTYSQVGDVIVYTIAISNNSRKNVYGLVIDHPLLDAINCNPDGWRQLMARESSTCTGQYIITEEDIVKGEVKNKVTVTGTYDKEICGLFVGTEFRASDTVLVNYVSQEISLEEISLEKTGSPATYTNVGDVITYSYKIENVGDVTLIGQVTVNDDLVEVLCPAGDLLLGGSIVCNATYMIQEADMVAGSVTNHATAFVGEITSNPASFEVVLEASPQISLTKSANPTEFSKSWDLITFNFQATNTGNVTLEPPYTLQDEMLDEWSCASSEPLLPGETLTCIGYYRIRGMDIGRTLDNCAKISGIYNGESVASGEVCIKVYYASPEEKEKQTESTPQ